MEAPKPAVWLSGLEFSWTANQDAFRLQLEEFSLQRGERVLRLGPSGCGKSTLLGLICGTLSAQRGDVEILGHNFSELSASAIDRFRADRIGVIFQQFNLLPDLSAVDNVLLPLQFSAPRLKRCGGNRKSARSHALELLEALGIDRNVLALQNAATLSVGQQQRVAAARAFIGAPELIVADEPTSALDENKQVDFLNILFEQCKRTSAALLMVSHNSRISQHFDRVVHLNELDKSSINKEVST